jgi:hypothetical protein
MKDCHQIIRSIIDGINFKPEYQFKTFLKSTYPNGNDVYERYKQEMTLENYIWAKNCERTRIYHN